MEEEELAFQSLYSDSDEEVVELLPPRNYNFDFDEDSEDETWNGNGVSEVIELSDDDYEEVEDVPAVPSPEVVQNAENISLTVMAQANGFCDEIRRLRDELEQAQQSLEQANQSLEEKDEQLEGLREENERLKEEAESGLSGDAREMKKMVSEERKLREETEEKLRKLRERVGQVFGEFVHFTEGIEQDLTQDGEEYGVEHLMDFVEERFQSYANNQNKLKTELAQVKQTVVELERVVESNKAGGDVAPRTFGNGVGSRKSILKPARPPPQIADENLPGTSAASANRDNGRDLLHQEDMSKSGVGFFCVCGQEYSTRSNLRIHIRTTTEEGKFTCKKCGQAFVLYYMLRRHLKDKHGVSTPKGAPSIGCADCGSLFFNFTQLHIHRKKQHPTEVSPQEQNRSSSRSELRHLLMPVDPDQPRRSRRASSAGPSSASSVYAEESGSDVEDDLDEDFAYDSRSRGTVIKHGFNTSKRHLGFYCHCGVKFRSRQRLQGHVKAYQDQGTSSSQSNPGTENSAGHAVDPNNVLRCMCGYVSNNKYNVSKHVVYHTVERHFACSLCPGKFINTTYLRQHYKRSHKEVKLDLNKIKLGCSKCGKSFQTRRAFHKHNMQVHYGVTNFFTKTSTIQKPASSVQGKIALGRNEKGHYVKGAVKKAQNVMYHLASKKKFPCTICDKAFEYLHQLARHKKTVHKVIQRKFQIGCGECGISFSSRQDHSRHRIIVHNSQIGRRSKTPKPVERQAAVDPLSVVEANVEDPNDDDDEWASVPEPVAIPLDMDYDADVDYEAFEVTLTPGTSRQPGTSQSQQQRQRDPLEPDQNTNRGGSAGVVQAHAIKGYQEGIGHFCICGVIFNEKKNLLSHIRRKTQEWNFTCKVCNKQFFYHATLKRHMKFTHKQMNIYKDKREKGVGCVKCGALFPTWNALRQHRSIAHDATDDPVSVQAPTTGHRLKTPMRSPRKVVVPAKPRNTPSTSAASRAALNRSSSDKATRHGMDQSKAHIAAFCLCGKRFATDKALKVHVQYNSRERNLPCELCDMKFICPSYLKQHMQRAHKGSGVSVQTKRFTKCTKCRRLFGTNVELFRHMKIAHGVQRYKGKLPHQSVKAQKRSLQTSQNQDNFADGDSNPTVHRWDKQASTARKQRCTCGREYFSTGGLRKHIRLSRDGRVFKCSYCPRVCAEYHALRRHTSSLHRVNLPEGVHACGICADVFHSHADLIQHRINVHGRR